jgi:hypothetical protein
MNHIRLIEIALPASEALPSKVHVVYRDGGERDLTTFLKIDILFRRAFPGIADFNAYLEASRGGKVTFDFSAGAV